MSQSDSYYPYRLWVLEREATIDNNTTTSATTTTSTSGARATALLSMSFVLIQRMVTANPSSPSPCCCCRSEQATMPASKTYIDPLGRRRRRYTSKTIRSCVTRRAMSLKERRRIEEMYTRPFSGCNSFVRIEEFYQDDKELYDARIDTLVLVWLDGGDNTELRLDRLRCLGGNSKRPRSGCRGLQAAYYWGP